MTTIKYVVNQHSPVALTQVFDQSDFNQKSFKNVPYEHIQVNPFCRLIVDRMMSYVQHLRKYQHVFIRVSMGPEKRGLWHLDSSLNPSEEYENFLFVSGEDTTEFILTPLTIVHANSALNFHRQIESQSFVAQKLKSNTIYRYTGSNAHRRPRICSPSPRILIRLSNTDVKHTIYD